LIGSQHHPKYVSLACQEFALGSREFFISQHAAVVQVGELLQLGRQVISRRDRRLRSCDLGRGRRILWLLRLGIGCTLLVRLVVLLLLGSILLGILLLLVVLDRTRRTGHNRRGDHSACYRSSTHSSSHHVDLFSFL
jgi:hypothetical protein